jgi:NAD(P)-dependent dehydrogenase (short-subunit alcohol dehydrogenase family)
MRLAGKRALVTGAASGIGRAVIAAFLHEGAQVIAGDITYSATSLGTDDREQTVQLDVTQEGHWERLAEGIGRLDLLVGCAGISEAKPIPETSLDDWRRVMNVNLDGAFLSVKYGARAMREGGAIVLVGSASGVKAAAGASAYCASKAALRMLVKTAALEFKSEAIRVNSVSPAAVVTPMWQKMPFWRGLVEKHGGEEGAWNVLGGIDPAVPSIQRMAFPEEIAAAIAFLSCDDSAHITGADLLVDGGYTL